MSARRILSSRSLLTATCRRAITTSRDVPLFRPSPSNYSFYQLSPRHSIRGIGSTFPKLKEEASAAAEETPAAAEGGTDGANDAQEGDDDCPVWQNPLHHNDPKFEKVFTEDYEPGEEMPIIPLPPFSSEGSDVDAPPHIHDLANEIIALNLMELAALMDRIGEHFGFDDSDAFGADSGGDGGDGDGAGEEVKEEKTSFDIKLEGFDAKSKIKVIKEIRTVTGLGLKEAKELVEGAPVSMLY
ncbi:hypothetical protein ACHAXN_003625 [Cyclotella atomus]